MEALKKACKKNGRITAVIIIVIAVLAFLFLGLDSIGYLTRSKITNDSDLSALEGKIVSVDLEYTIEVYETITKGNKNNPVFTGYAVMLADKDGKKGHYIGVWRPVKTDDEMDKYLDELYAYWYDGAAKPESKIVSGVLVKMDSTDKKYMDQFLKEAAEYGFGGDVEYYYVIEGQTNESADKSITVALVCGAGTVLLLIIGLVFFARAGAGWDKKLKKFINNTPGASMESIEAEVESGVAFNNGSIVVGKKYVVYANSSVNAVDLEKICWGYHYRRTGRNAVNQMRLYDIAGNCICIDSNPDLTKDVLTEMLKNCDWIIAGYKPEWDKMYRKSREEFLRLHYYEGRQGNASNAGFDDVNSSTDTEMADEPETTSENNTEE